MSEKHEQRLLQEQDALRQDKTDVEVALRASKQVMEKRCRPLLVATQLACIRVYTALCISSTCITFTGISLDTSTCILVSHLYTALAYKCFMCITFTGISLVTARASLALVSPALVSH